MGKPRRRQDDTNPLFALRSGTLATLDEIEAAAKAHAKEDIFLDGEQEDLIRIIPSLCMQIRVEARRARTAKATATKGERT